MSDEGAELSLPGSRACIGCGGLTFRRRGDDALCPRCAFETEELMEHIELESLERDLQLMTQFDAYYRERETQRKRFKRLAAPVFTRRPVLDPVSRPAPDISADELRAELRDLLEPLRRAS